MVEHLQELIANNWDITKDIGIGCLVLILIIAWYILRSDRNTAIVTDGATPLFAKEVSAITAWSLLRTQMDLNTVPPLWSAPNGPTIFMQANSCFVFWDRTNGMILIKGWDELIRDGFIDQLKANFERLLTLQSGIYFERDLTVYSVIAASHVPTLQQMLRSYSCNAMPLMYHMNSVDIRKLRYIIPKHFYHYPRIDEMMIRREYMPGDGSYHISDRSFIGRGKKDDSSVRFKEIVINKKVFSKIKLIAIEREQGASIGNIAIKREEGRQKQLQRSRLDNL